MRSDVYAVFVEYKAKRRADLLYDLCDVVVHLLKGHASSIGSNRLLLLSLLLLLLLHPLLQQL